MDGFLSYDEELGVEYEGPGIRVGGCMKRLTICFCTECMHFKFLGDGETGLCNLSNEVLPYPEKTVSGFAGERYLVWEIPEWCELGDA